MTFKNMENIKSDLSFELDEKMDSISMYEYVNVYLISNKRDLNSIYIESCVMNKIIDEIFSIIVPNIQNECSMSIYNTLIVSKFYKTMNPF